MEPFFGLFCYFLLFLIRVWPGTPIHLPVTPNLRDYRFMLPQLVSYLRDGISLVLPLNSVLWVLASPVMELQTWASRPSLKFYFLTTKIISLIIFSAIDESSGVWWFCDFQSSTSGFLKFFYSFIHMCLYWVISPPCHPHPPCPPTPLPSRQNLFCPFP
jgi:hypothetical protein